LFFFFVAFGTGAAEMLLVYFKISVPPTP